VDRIVLNGNIPYNIITLFIDLYAIAHIGKNVAMCNGNVLGDGYNAGG
jgi:hypothetical protein